MTPSVQLAIISKMAKEDHLLGKFACLSSSSLHSSRKTATSLYKVFVKYFIPSVHPILMMFTKVM